MKNVALFILLSAIPLLTSSCLLAPDKEFVTDTLTVTVHDTLRVTNTVTIRDTLRLHDTLIITINIHDTTYSDTLRLHDTTHITNTVTVHDTITKHDTVRTTITIHDTTTIHDTLRTFATTTVSSALAGSWRGTVGGKAVVLTITTSTVVYAFTYTANIGTGSYNGKIDTYTNNTAHCIYMYGPGMIGETADWIISISNNVMTLQQSGYQMYPTTQAFTLNRIL